MANERMDWLEVEERIEKRIAEESEIYDLDSSDIAEIRLETYKECGWSYDAGKDEDEDEEDEEIEYEPTYRSLSAIYFDLGLNIRDHFCCR
jgi:hypothetical protein